MNRIYKYNPNASYEPNQGTYLQQVGSKDLYIQKGGRDRGYKFRR